MLSLDNIIIERDFLHFQNTQRKKVAKTLRIDIDDESFDRLDSHISHPIVITKPVQKIVVRTISQFGEEITKVLKVK